MVDVARAFRQSQSLDMDGRYTAFPTPCLDLGGFVRCGSFFTVGVSGRRNSYGFLRNKPTYGSKCAPIRWFLTISAVMKEAGYYRHHLDTNVFSKSVGISGKIQLSSVLITHVDAILTCGTEDEIRFLEHHYIFRGVRNCATS